MLKYKKKISDMGYNTLYRINIRIDIPGRNSIQIRNRLEGAIRPSGRKPFADYMLFGKNRFYRVAGVRRYESVLETHIQRYIFIHYKAYMKSNGYAVRNSPIVFRYQEWRGSLLLTFLMTLAGGITLELIKPYLQDLAVSLKGHIHELLNKQESETEKKGDVQIRINIYSFNNGERNV